MRGIVRGFLMLWAGLAVVAVEAAEVTDWGSLERHSLVRQAEKACPERVAFARRLGARLAAVEGGKTFALVWVPAGAVRPPIIATLSGHGSWAFDEFFLWQKEAAARGFGIVALQWWLGTGEGPRDYLLPNEVYRSFDRVFGQEGIPAGRNLLHGFSRGSANIYGVTALDRHAGRGLFLLTIANAGKAGADFPINRDIERGRFGERPFAGTRWVLYGGGRDPHPERDGIPGMREAEAWVIRHGGTVDLFLADADGDHGGFHRRSQNMTAALDLFKRLLTNTGGLHQRTGPFPGK